MDPTKFNIVNDKFCILPWIHLQTWPNGKVYQCCITGFENYIGDLNTETLEDVWNGEHMKGLRKQMLDNQGPSSCSKCYQQEEMGARSFRQSSNSQFWEHADSLVDKTADDGTLDEFNLLYWDFRFSNLCNMKCRMCGDLLSSLWAEENNTRLGGNSNNDFDIKKHGKGVVVNMATGVDLYRYIDMFIDNVEEIYFAGGEPLLMAEHYYILEQLIERGRTHVRIRYNTNLSKLEHGGKSCLDLWEKFDHVHIVASIDAMAERGEYSRKGTVWSTIEKNLRKLVDTPGLIVAVSPTINIFNIYHLPDFIDFLLEIGVPLIHLNNVLTAPEWYHVNTLRPQDKNKMIMRLRGHAERTFDESLSHYKKDYEYIINYINQTVPEEQLAQHRAQFKQITDQLDEFRKEKFTDVFPELEDYYNSL